MSRASLAKLAAPAVRSTLVRGVNRSFVLAQPFASISKNGTSKILAYRGAKSPLVRAFSTTVARPLGLSPESEEPPAKEENTETREYNVGGKAADLTPEQYHQLSDNYLNVLVDRFEQMQEDNEQVDCEYSAGVLTLVFPPNGTYILNKQPANKQIWLSSPISGPKRYDYVVTSEGQNAKEGTGVGDWVYLRDGSTLADVMQKELGVDMSETSDESSTSWKHGRNDDMKGK